MRKRMNLFMRFSCLLMLVFATSSIQAQDRLYADEFPLGDVTLLDGPLKKARDLNIRVTVCWHLILRRQDLPLKESRIRTGTDSTDMWADII